MGFSRSLAAVLCFCHFAFGCAEPPSPATPPGVVARRALRDYIPSDLDLILRVDLERLKTLVPGAATRLGTLTDGSEHPAATRLLARGLDSARVVYIGFRLTPEGVPADSVMVLDAVRQPIDAADYLAAFLPQRELGGGLSVRNGRGEPRRSEPARLYTTLDGLWVVATVAELDAVERTVELGESGTSLSVPPEGLVSFAWSARGVLPFLERNSPKAARFFERATSFSGVFDARAGVFTGKIEVGFRSAEDAEKALPAISIFARLLFEQRKEVEEGLEVNVERLGTSVVVKLALAESIALAL